jgi:hypothetical protein
LSNSEPFDYAQLSIEPLQFLTTAIFGSSFYNQLEVNNLSVIVGCIENIG